VKLARTRSLLASTVLVAVVVGFLEATAMSLVGEPAGGFGRALAAWAISFSLASVGALPAALLLQLGLALLARLRLGRQVWGDLTSGGASRVVVVWRALLAVVAIGVFAYLSFRLAAWTYRHYPKREPALFVNRKSPRQRVWAATSSTPRSRCTGWRTMDEGRNSIVKVCPWPTCRSCCST
jgi:hypothetical protein